MNLNTWKGFGHAVYGCFDRAADARFNTIDALSSEAGAHSFPELSLSPFFERRWPSLYEAFEDGHIHRKRLQETFLRFAPVGEASNVVWIGVDSSNLYRPEAQTAADRSVVSLPNLPESDRPISSGWCISTVVLLPEEAGQGSSILDSQRIPSTHLATEGAARPLKELLSRGVHPIILADRWYTCAPFLARTADLEATLLLRVKRNRVFSRRAPQRRLGQRGASRKEGNRFQCSEPSTHGSRMGSGEALMKKVDSLRFAVGTTCICARLDGLRSRCSRSSGREPVENLVIPEKAGLSVGGPADRPFAGELAVSTPLFSGAWLSV